MKARIPADVEMPDRIFFGLTFRQISIVAIDAFSVWGLFILLRERLEMWAIGLVCAPLVIVGLIFVAARPAGVNFERFLGFAVRHLLGPKRFVDKTAASRRRDVRPEPMTSLPAAETSPGGFALPVRGVADNGAIDLGSEGILAVCRASSLNFALRSQAEKKLLTGGFARLLNSLGGPVQFLIHSEPADAKALIKTLEDRAPKLPNPSLAAAAFSYADFLSSMTSQSDVLTSSVFVCLRERRRTRESARRLDRRAEELSTLVRELGVAVTRLEGREAIALLDGTADPSIAGSADPGGGGCTDAHWTAQAEAGKRVHGDKLAPRGGARMGEALC